MCIRLPYYGLPWCAKFCVGKFQTNFNSSNVSEDLLSLKQARSIPPEQSSTPSHQLTPVTEELQPIKQIEFHLTTGWYQFNNYLQSPKENLVNIITSTASNSFRLYFKELRYVQTYSFSLQWINHIQYLLKTDELLNTHRLALYLNKLRFLKTFDYLITSDPSKKT
jgi:hypothetical protein